MGRHAHPRPPDGGAAEDWVRRYQPARRRRRPSKEACRVRDPTLAVGLVLTHTFKSLAQADLLTIVVDCARRRVD